MRKFLTYAIFIFMYNMPFNFAWAADTALVLEVNNPIQPATHEYIHRGMLYAKKINAATIILQLNTSSGLQSSTRRINQEIITSPIPVIAYVAPSYAKVTDNGVYIMYASHLSAMAPNTVLGPTTPLVTFKQSKANDDTSYLNSLARLRGRNADWAEISIRKNASINAKEAKKIKVIDEIADDYSELLQKLDGHKVLVLGISENIATKNLKIKRMPPDWRYAALEIITDPNVIYLLMLFSIYGLFFEFTHPGFILPGLLSIVTLLIGFYAMQLVDFNYTGLVFFFTGIMLMALEAYVSLIGILGTGGVISFIVGSKMLFNLNEQLHPLNWTLILMMTAISVSFFFIIINLKLKSKYE